MFAELATASHNNPLEQLQIEQPLVVQFFESAICLGRLAHAYVLTGNAIEAQYALALQVATVLNCSQPLAPLQPCGQCRSCKWLANNAHPLVTTITRLNFDPPSHWEKERETARTLISTGQIGYLLETLSRKVGELEYRVVIFADAYTSTTHAHSNVLPPFDWVAKQQGSNDAHSEVELSTTSKRATSKKNTKTPQGTFQLAPITADVFNAASVNRFLKSLEEPHPRTLFFFLTENERTLLPTVVSRCQVVPFRSVPPASQPTSILQPWLQAVLQMPATKRIDFYPVVHQFQAISKESGLDPLVLLEQLQRYLSSSGVVVWQQLLGDDRVLQRYAQLQQLLAQTRKLLDAKVHEGAAIQQLILALWAI
jgi:DNA polymerase III delta prime subunit